MNKFTIIIPMFNSEKFIANTLKSIIDTDYNKDNIEVYVIDDGSTDDSSEIVKSISKENPFIKYVKKDNGHWGSVINYAKNNLDLNGDYVSILDSDDFYTKNTFNVINKLALKNNDDLIVGSFRKYDGNKPRKKVMPYWFIFKRVLKNKSQMNTPFCLPLPFFVKKDIFLRLNDLREGVAYQDPDYSTQLVKNSSSLIFTKKVTGLYYYNRENNSISQKWDDKRLEPEFYACLKCIENDAQELVSYRLNIKDFRECVIKNNLKFKVNRKFKFNWYPFYIRWAYWLIHTIKYKKFFY